MSSLSSTLTLLCHACETVRDGEDVIFSFGGSARVAVLYFVMFANQLDRMITLAMESVCRCKLKHWNVSFDQTSFNHAVFKSSSDAATT